MGIHEDPEVDTFEKVTRFVCGALLGVFVGIYVAFRFTHFSFGLTTAIIFGAVLICGFLALKFGDEFWYVVFGRSR